MKHYIAIFSAIISFFALSGCGKNALFDSLETSSLQVILKGTFESNSPRDWITTVINDDSMVVFPPAAVTSAIKPAGYDNYPSVYNLDVSEIQMDGEQFANYRQVFQQAMTDTDPFFNGVGVGFACQDVVLDKYYWQAEVFLRKNAFDNAHSFFPTYGTYIGILQSLFNEVKSPGYDFTGYGVWSMYDSLRLERTDINRIFPVALNFDVPFVFSKGSTDAVVELRLIVKNYVKRYERIVLSSGLRYSYHYFAYSDWLRDQRAGDVYCGGTLIGVARWYNLSKVTNVVGSIGPSGGWVIAIPATDSIADYQITAAQRERPADMFSPRMVPLSGTHISNLLEYSTDYMKYADDYYQYYWSLITDPTVYIYKWWNYEVKIFFLKIPPLAVYTTDGNFIMRNVQTGRSYKFYYASGSGVGSGELPSTYSGAGTVQYVPETSIGSTWTLTGW